MITAPSNAIPTPKEKAAQLKAVEGRLATLIYEVRDAEKQLDTLRKETVTIQKDRNYQQELLTQVKASVLEQEAKMLQLQQEYASLREANEKSRTLLSEQLTEHDTKHRALAAREKAVKDAEDTHADRAAELDKHANKIAAQKVEVELAQKAFKKATESIVWK